MMAFCYFWHQQFPSAWTTSCQTSTFSFKQNNKFVSIASITEKNICRLELPITSSSSALAFPYLSLWFQQRTITSSFKPVSTRNKNTKRCPSDGPQTQQRHHRLISELFSLQWQNPLISHLERPSPDPPSPYWNDSPSPKGPFNQRPLTTKAYCPTYPPSLPYLNLLPLPARAHSCPHFLHYT